jgi:hypothetical protein
MIKLGLSEKAIERVAGVIGKTAESPFTPEKLENPNELGGASLGVILADGTSIYVRDNKITDPKPEYNYYPVRGYSSSVVVSDETGHFVGWMDIWDLGFDKVKEWMDSDPEQMRLELPAGQEEPDEKEPAL